MSTDTKVVVQQLYTAWKARDLPAVLSFVADEMVFALHIPTDVMPLGGETKGKTAVAAALQGLLDNYDFLTYEPGPVAAEGTKATCEVQFRYRQKATNEVIDSRLRHEWLVEAGKVQRLDEWHDLPKVKAYFDRVALRIASKSA